MKTKRKQYDDLYNGSRKEMFLDSYEDAGTRVNYKYVLAKCEPYEQRLDKDLGDFNHEDLDMLLHGLNAKSLQSISYQVSVIQKYIKFAIEEGFSNNSINYATLPSFSGQSLNVYVNTIWREQRIMNREDIYKTIIEETENAQDGVIFALLFEGVYGEGLSELRNLKKSDVDGNRIHLTDESGEQRSILVSSECISIVNEAAQQEEYFKTILADDGKVHAEKYELYDSEFVLRLIDRKGAEDQISAQAIRQRFKKIKDFYKNHYLTPSSVRLSGMIDMARHIVKERNLSSIEDLTTEHYQLINRQFGLDESKFYVTKMKILQHAQ